MSLQHLTMHCCWRILEILLDILDVSTPSTFAALAGARKTLQDPALDTLWGDYEDFYLLTKTMLTDLILEVSDTNRHHKCQPVS